MKTDDLERRTITDPVQFTVGGTFTEVRDVAAWRDFPTPYTPPRRSRTMSNPSTPSPERGAISQSRAFYMLETPHPENGEVWWCGHREDRHTPVWSDDWTQAVHFGRRVDAENVLRIMQYYTRETNRGWGYTSLGVFVSEHLEMCPTAESELAALEAENSALRARLAAAEEDKSLKESAYVQMRAERDYWVGLCRAKKDDVQALMDRLNRIAESE